MITTDNMSAKEAIKLKNYGATYSINGVKYVVVKKSKYLDMYGNTLVDYATFLNTNTWEVLSEHSLRTVLASI